MKFNFEGSTYEIEFERQRKQKQLKGQTPSRLTTVRIIRDKPNALPGEVYRTATSACSVLDQFNLEKGRLAALRLVSKTLTKDFKHAMWHAYMNRFPKPELDNVLKFPIQGA